MKKFKVEYYCYGGRYVHLYMQGKSIEKIFPICPDSKKSLNHFTESNMFYEDSSRGNAMTKLSNHRPCKNTKCESWLSNIEVHALATKYGEEIYPTDVYWKNCIMGQDCYLNCQERNKT